MVKNPRKKACPGPIRALNQPEPVQVEENGRRRPVAVTLGRREGRVTSIEDVWEIEDEWWRQRPISRRYYRVLLKDGSGMTLFRDLLNSLWYEQKT